MRQTKMMFNFATSIKMYGYNIYEKLIQQIEILEKKFMLERNLYNNTYTNDYFPLAFDHLYSKHLFEVAGVVETSVSSIKSNHHNQS